MSDGRGGVGRCRARTGRGPRCRRCARGRGGQRSYATSPVRVARSTSNSNGRASTPPPRRGEANLTGAERGRGGGARPPPPGPAAGGGGPREGGGGGGGGGG